MPNNSSGCLIGIKTTSLIGSVGSSWAFAAHCSLYPRFVVLSTHYRWHPRGHHALPYADRLAHPDSLPRSAGVHAATHLHACVHVDTVSYADRPAYPDTLPGSADTNSIPNPNPPAHTDAHSPTPAISTPQHAEYTVALQKLPRYRPPNPSVPLGPGRAHRL